MLAVENVIRAEVSLSLSLSSCFFMCVCVFFMFFFSVRNGHCTEGVKKKIKKK